MTPQDDATGQFSLDDIEAALRRAAPEQQRLFLVHLPQLLDFSVEDVGWTRLSEKSFDFWDNSEDEVYDNL